MHLVDIIHGYQPFTSVLMKPWVKDNLREVFLPTSESMKRGTIKQNVQLQGWTIDMYKKNSIGRKFLENLRQAARKHNITVGCSLYNHAIMPLLTDELLLELIRIDYRTVKQSIGTPVFFFPPELAVDRRVLGILFDNFPGLVPVIPSLAVSSKESCVVNVIHRDKKHMCLAANVHLKDTLMNRTGSRKIAESPMRSPANFRETLVMLDRTDVHILARDWENGESRDALTGRKEKYVRGFYRYRKDFCLITELKAKKSISIERIVPSCWEPLSSRENPYPYWIPKTDRTGVAKSWLALISLYEHAFSKLPNAEKNIDIIKETSPALLSCVPWHYFSGGDIDFAVELMEKIVKPRLLKLIEKVYDEKEQLEKLIKINELANRIVSISALDFPVSR